MYEYLYMYYVSKKTTLFNWLRYDPLCKWDDDEKINIYDPDSMDESTKKSLRDEKVSTRIRLKSNPDGLSTHTLVPCV
jgi:hypothetical protein